MVHGSVQRVEVWLPDHGLTAKLLRLIRSKYNYTLKNIVVAGKHFKNKLIASEITMAKQGPIYYFLARKIIS